MSTDFPEAFLQRVKRQLKEEYPAFLSAMTERPIRGVRFHPFRPEDKWIPEIEDPIPWTHQAYELPADSTAGVTVAHEAGAFYLQDPCAMIPAAVLRAKPGEKILDLCAAPGGKSTQIGIDMAGEGLLICNEPIPKRAAVLSRNLERMGIPNSIVTCAYPEVLASRWSEGFDGVLADVPCSGEGMFRKNPESRSEWSPLQAEGCAMRQKIILDQASRMVRSGGRLVYSTCTWNPRENEEQIESFLDMHPDFVLESFSLPGIGSTDGFYTCWPHRIRGEGQFAALFRKRGNGSVQCTDGSVAFRMDSESIRFIKNSVIPTEEPNAVFGKTLVRISEIPDLRGIQVLRMGTHLGQIRGRVYIPDHAAALAFQRPETPETELDTEEARKYLSGQTIERDVRGWTVMTWKGLALGWGKGSDGILRNHYPKGLRNSLLI